MSLIRKLLALCAFTLLAACSTPTTVAVPQPMATLNDARIVILRPRAWSYSSVTARVALSGVAVGKLAQESYLMAVRPAGRYTLTVKFPFDLMGLAHTFDAVPGRTYYFAVNIKSGEIPITGGGFFAIPGSVPMGQEVQGSNPFADDYISELDPQTAESFIGAMQAQQRAR